MPVPQSYIELVDALKNSYAEIDGCSFYRFIFPNNEKQGEWHTNFSKPNALYLYQDEQDEGTQRKLRRRVMLADKWDQDYLDFVEGNPMTLCSGLSYRKRANRLENAQRMNALVIDLDGVGGYEFRNLFLRFGKPAESLRTLPVPTFLVVSGAGLHVYYVFDEPIDLYPNIKLQLKSLKYDLTFRMWEYKSTSTQKEIQYQSINQGFRMVGSVNNKYGTPLRAFQIGDRVTLDYINQYVNQQSQVDVNCPFRPSQITRAEAKEAYPEWYQRVVVEKNKRQKKWDIKGKQGFALYHWWLNRMNEVRGGHRYFYLLCLVIYACKCDVPREKLQEDMQTVFEKLRQIYHENPLTQEDMKSALETYDKEYYNFTIADIEKLTDIRIERNKRNYQKQKDHLEEARAIRDLRMKRQDKDWRMGNGRPSAERKVFEYLQTHPDASKAEVIRETGLSRPTVYKHFNKIKQGT